MRTKIGMIGVGMMGHGIATNVAKNNFPLTVLNHPENRPLDALLTHGITAVDSIAELAGSSETIILCVTGSAQVEAILHGNDGLLEHLRPDMVLIDCSTAIPSSTEKIAKSVISTGAKFLDAPMTRTPKEAAEGRLNLIVGGDKEVFEHSRELLSVFSENIVYAGPTAAGHRVKLLHNFVSLGFSALLAEAAACAARSGVDPAVLVEVLESGAGEGAILRRIAPYIESGDTSYFQFSIRNALKDMSYYTTMATDVGAACKTATAVRDVYQEASETSEPMATVPELVKILRNSANPVTDR